MAKAIGLKRVAAHGQDVFVRIDGDQSVGILRRGQCAGQAQRILPDDSASCRANNQGTWKRRSRMRRRCARPTACRSPIRKFIPDAPWRRDVDDWHRESTCAGLARSRALARWGRVRPALGLCLRRASVPIPLPGCRASRATARPASRSVRRYG